MSTDNRRYCPVCARPLIRRVIAEHERLLCSSRDCDYIFWDNPIPVVAGIVEHQGRLVLARNAAWPQGMYGLVTGFLEPREDPEAGMIREVAEELGLAATGLTFVGAYGFARKNQVLLAYHLIGEGDIRLNAELVEYWHIAKDRAQYWPGGTGLAVRDWLRAQGYDPQPRELPPAVDAWLNAESDEPDDGGLGC